MVKYYCIRCGYNTIQKNSFRLHLNRKNLCRPKLNDIDIIQVYKHNKMEVPTSMHVDNTHKNTQKTHKHTENGEIVLKNPEFFDKNFNTNFECKFCKKKFSRIDSRSRHVKKYCKNKNGLVLSPKENSEIELLKKEISKLKRKKRSKITKITNNNNNNIIINNFGDHIRGFEYITQDRLDYILKNPDKSLQKMIVEKHFHKDHPENHNIKINNLAGKYALVYINKNWITITKKEVIEELLDDGYEELTVFYSTNEDNIFIRRRFNALQELYDNKNDKSDIFHDTNRVIFNETQKLNN